MPCDSSYLHSTPRELALRRAAQLYSYVLTSLGQKVPSAVTHAAADSWCDKDFVPHLCGAIRDMATADRERIVYNAHDKTARDLADWWEEHQKADAARETTSVEAPPSSPA